MAEEPKYSFGAHSGDDLEKVAETYVREVANISFEKTHDLMELCLGILCKLAAMGVHIDVQEIMKIWKKVSEESGLSVEYNYYLAHKTELLQKYKGQFVVIKGSKMIAPFATFEDAFGAGLKEFGLVVMLVKEVTEEEPPAAQITRLIVGF